MTENEAIMVIENERPSCGEKIKLTEEEKCEAYNMAIQALEEVQQYRAIGTPEKCRKAVEKQTSKEPDCEGDGYSNGQLVYDTWICPCCGHHYEVDYDDYDYCPKCGQHIDWSDENEEID